MVRKYLQNCTCSCTLTVLQSIKHLHLQYQKIRANRTVFSCTQNTYSFQWCPLDAHPWQKLSYQWDVSKLYPTQREDPLEAGLPNQFNIGDPNPDWSTVAVLVLVHEMAQDTCSYTATWFNSFSSPDSRGKNTWRMYSPHTWRILAPDTFLQQKDNQTYVFRHHWSTNNSAMSL